MAVTTPEVDISLSREELIEKVSDKFYKIIIELTAVKDSVHISLTGGRVGIELLAHLAEKSESYKEVDWQKIHFWWGDERWLSADSSDRNSNQAFEVFLNKIAIPENNLHWPPSSDQGLSLQEAAIQYRNELYSYGEASNSFPEFDLILLGVGPDAHIASLFPGNQEVLNPDLTVVAVESSPKPPAERLSFSLPAINNANRIWLVLSGEDKASALRLALAGMDRFEVPVAGVAAKGETIFFADTEAAAELESSTQNPQQDEFHSLA